MALIVILDDRTTNRHIFSKLAGLIEDGVQVESFGDPVAALEWLKSHTPDLVITDFKMPNLDGAEFVRRFRELPSCTDVPVIVITVYEERTFRLKALESGATDFLLSPVDHHEFLTRARNLLRLRRQQEIIKSRAFLLERELEDSERTREAMLRDSRERLAQVIDTVPAMISATDREGRCVFVNAYQAQVYGLDPAAVIGQDIAEVLGAESGLRSRTLDQLVFRSGQALPSFEDEVVDRQGLKRTLLTTKAPLRDGAGQIAHVLTTSLDISERKRAEHHLAHLAHHDTLTGLPNRSLLHDRVRREIARARRGDRFFALHLLDLDRFKGINDALGHAVGDRLLIAIGERLAQTIRDVDTVARLGGDEFAILQVGIGRPEDAFELARRVIDVVAEPVSVGERSIVTSASLGIAIHPTDGADVEELLKSADLAMYQAKAEGRHTFRLFATHLTDAAHQEIDLETSLRQALARQEFVLHYQPQVDLRSGRIIGAEALLRWNRPGHGQVGPADFLPFAEENGLIIPINEWVLREACRQAREWEQTGLASIRVAVNLSPVQFRKQDVCEIVSSVLQETGLDPTLLELELTENIVMQNRDAVASDMRRLQELGVAFAIDDFGTGYSSLAYVKSFPADRLKIDQCFTRSVKTDPNDAAIVRAIISLAHSLGLKVIAEGVEGLDEVNWLRTEGCDEVQGYYFSRPVPAEAFAELVRKDRDVARTA